MSELATRATRRGASPGSRSHLIGTAAFRPDAELAEIVEIFSTFVRAFVPASGLAVRVTRGSRCEVLATRFAATASVKAAQLARGGVVELSAGDFEAPGGASPLFWIASTPTEEALEHGVVAVRLGASFPRPKAPRAEDAIAHAVATLLEAAGDVEGCVSAIGAAEPTPLSVTDDALATERASETAARRDDLAWLEGHVRAAAPWVLVPAARTGALSRPPPDVVTLRRIATGVLVTTDVGSPFAPDPKALATLRTWLAPLLA